MALLTAMIPAHNAEKTLSAAIRSILNQSFTDFELWILENGSTDKTLDIAQSFIETDSRVKVFDLGPIGFQGAMQWGLENSNTTYIARMDADDICLPKRFETQIDHLEKHPEHVLHGCAPLLLTPFNHIIKQKDRTTVDGEVGFMHMSDIPNQPKRYYADPSTMFRRDVALSVGGYDPDYNIGDVSLWIRMLQHHKGYQTATPLIIYRLVNKSMSNTLKFNTQTRSCRTKYYGQHYEVLDEVSTTMESESPYWLRVANLELLAGDSQSYARAMENARASGLLSTRIKEVFKGIYQAYHLGRYGIKYERMRHVESEFSSFLGQHHTK